MEKENNLLPENIREVQSEVKIINVLNQSLKHSITVAKLSDKLFEAFFSLHSLPHRYKKILHKAALLHDIGWIYGQKAHHKSTLAIILQYAKYGKFVPVVEMEKAVVKKINSLLSKQIGHIDKNSIVLIALIARYHRKALPNDAHNLFSSLSRKNKEIVRKLSALIRLADACDYSHLAKVKGFSIEIYEEEVKFSFVSKENTENEMIRIEKKKELFEEVYHKKLLCEPLDLEEKK